MLPLQRRYKRGVLLSDIELYDKVNFTNNLNLDLAGHNITAPKNNYALYVEKNFTLITYKNSQNKEYDIEFADSELDNYESKTTYGRDPIFANREMAIKHVMDLFEYRKEKLAKLQAQYDKERDYIEKYKECLKNLPD